MLPVKRSDVTVLLFPRHFNPHSSQGAQTQGVAGRGEAPQETDYHLTSQWKHVIVVVSSIEFTIVNVKCHCGYICIFKYIYIDIYIYCIFIYMYVFPFRDISELQ